MTKANPATAANAGSVKMTPEMAARFIQELRYMHVVLDRFIYNPTPKLDHLMCRPRTL